LFVTCGEFSFLCKAVENHQGFWGGEIQSWKITVGEVDWSEPSDRVHRAVNAGNEVFEEVVIFFLDHPEAEPQPEEA
jgi:hypothetical protein